MFPVIQLIDGFATEEAPGGAAQFGIQLARHLDRQQFQPIVVGLWRYNTPSERRWRDQLAHEGIETAILIEERGRLAVDMLRAWARLQVIIDRTGAYVLNSHFERGDLLELATKLQRLGRVAIVRTQHADQQWQNRPWLGSLLNLAAFPWLFDAEVAISEATRQVMDKRVAARVRRRRCNLIYNGLAPAAQRELYQARLAAARPVGGARLLIIGRLEAQKNHADAIRALAEVRTHRPDAELWVVGHGSLLHSLQSLTKELGVADAVTFLGQRSDIANLLANADILVSSSIWEGFPTVVLEAMVAGVPVIATDVSGSRELVRNGETGTLVPMRSWQAIAKALLQILAEPHTAQVMAQRAQQEARHHSFDTIAHQYGHCYQTLIHQE